MSNVDLYEYIGREVEVTIYRKRYSNPEHVRIHTGILTDIGHNMVCLERGGRYHWVPKPNRFKDEIKEL